jgi:hypothetical protein
MEPERKTPSLDLQSIDNTLDGVKSRWDHADAPYNADMLALIRTAEELRGTVGSLGDRDADPHNGRPVYGEPRFDEEVRNKDPWEIEPTHIEPEAARWDLSGGACLSYGHIEDYDGPLLVSLHISDYTLKTGVVQRIVTPEQVRDHALHLLRLVGAQPTYVLPEARS